MTDASSKRSNVTLIRNDWVSFLEPVRARTVRWNFIAVSMKLWKMFFSTVWRLLKSVSKNIGLVWILKALREIRYADGIHQ